MSRRPREGTSRRRFLGAVSAAALGTACWPLTRAYAGASSERRLVVCYLDGGWDTLLGPDPRDPSRAYAGVTLGVDRLAEADRTPFELRLGQGTAQLGPTMAALAPHADVLTVFRGVNMNTVAHDVGRAYVLTGKRPAGSEARGSSLGTVLATSGRLDAGGPPLPHVSIALEAYNDGQPAAASAVPLASAADIAAIVGAPARALDARMETLLDAARARSSSCVGPRYVGSSIVEDHALAEQRLLRLRGADEAAAFAFGDGGRVEHDATRALYGIGPGTSNAPGERAAVAATLLKRGLSRCVSFTVEYGFDTHGADWAVHQAARQRRAFGAIAALVTDIRSSLDPEMRNTTVLVVSEFARTPLINAGGGRDHWFANAMLVLGGNLAPGVIGATAEEDFGLLEIDLATGRPAAGGAILTPEHVAATLVHGAGLDSRVFRVPPVTSWLRSGEGAAR